MTASLPPRGPALADRDYLLVFDVDCGELLPGHRFIARGLSRAEAWTGPFDDGPAVPGFCLEYELSPGVPPVDDADFYRYLVGVQYEADVVLPWEPSDGGAIAPFEGGATTHGARGTWPLPDGARRLTFALYPVPPGARFPADRPAGALVVDLREGTARWEPRA